MRILVLAATLLVGCAPGPQWVNVEGFAPPRNPHVSFVAVYEPWARESVVKTDDGEVLKAAAIHAKCLNATCQEGSSGIHVDKASPKLDHLELLVEPPAGSDYEPVRIDVPYGPDAPAGATYVVFFHRKATP